MPQQFENVIKTPKVTFPTRLAEFSYRIFDCRSVQVGIEFNRWPANLTTTEANQMNTTHIDVIVKSAAQRAASKKTEKTEHKKFSSCGQPFCPPPLRMIAYEDMKPNL